MAATTRGTPQRASYDLVGEHYGAGFNGPWWWSPKPAAGGALTTADLVDTYNDLRRMPGVAVGEPGTVSDTADTAVFSVVPTEGPDGRGHRPTGARHPGSTPDRCRNCATSTSASPA